MGTEILVLFLPVPLLLWAWDLWRVTKPTHRRKSLLLLGLGIAFMACFVLPITTKQYFLQGLIFGSVFYAPFYLLASLTIKALSSRTNDVPKEI